ncbi:hypothetical protein, partial [Vibrio parahaemolyticus]|uniref:hypothetical protein n=1 Tax=Vibrio parahaemolyticus TaxID=670 RepID=UPI001EEBE0FF
HVDARDWRSQKQNAARLAFGITERPSAAQQASIIHTSKSFYSRHGSIGRILHLFLLEQL